jgi:GAF domain-containing protein
LPTLEQIETLRRGLPITPDVQQANELTQRELAPLNIAWAASFALRAGDEILGTLDILHTQPCNLTTEEIDAFTMLADQISVTLQNHRLLDDARYSADEFSKQVRLLQIINELATTISSTQDEKTLLDTSCRALVEATGLDHSSIALITAAGTAAQVLSEHPMKGTVGVLLPLADNAVFDIIRDTRQPLVIADIDSDTRLPAASQHLLQRMGVHAMMVMPLFTSDRLVGSISLDVYTTDKPITPDIVDTALSVAAQVSLGIQNTRLLAEAQRRAEQLQRITAFSQSVQATLDLPTIFNNMLAESALMLTQDQMNISLYDAGQDALRVVAEHSGGQTRVNPNSGSFMPISGHIATAWNNREMLHIPDLYKLRDHVDTESDIRAWMVAPLQVRGRMLGLVSVGSVRAYAYTDTDVALFQQMVSQLAVAIENVEAYTQSQRMVKNESLLNSISTQLQNQMNIEHMMDITAHELGKALGARRVRIRFGSPDGSS